MIVAYKKCTQGKKIKKLFLRNESVMLCGDVFS